LKENPCGKQGFLYNIFSLKSQGNFGIFNKFIERKGMSEPSEWKWIDWARRLQSLAQIGLEYAENEYDGERYRSVLTVAAEMLEAGSDFEPERIRGLLQSQTGYATPKVDVRGAVIRKDSILLVRERQDGGWTLPGGWADTGETPSQAAAREVWEESGFRVRPVRLIAAWDRTLHGHVPPHPFRIYKLFFLCDLVGGEAKPSRETSEVGFFREDVIPPLSLGRTTPSQITRIFDHHRNPDLPADFD
jgi:ADP-ribose pyrophosphatase YjhB (NUDIX family)